MQHEHDALNSDHLSEATSLRQQLVNMDTSAGHAFFMGSAQQEDMIRLKGQLQECERELQDCQSNYDRDRALWEGKCLFLEQQKDTYKRDLLDSQRKFEMTLEQLQKRSTLDKDKAEERQSQMVKMLESKYKNQIKEICTANQILIQEQREKSKRLETELQDLQQKYADETKGKFDESSSLERRLSEAECAVEQLSQELQDEKDDRLRRITELQRQIDRDRESHKLKVCDLDRKAKETEARRAQLYFQIEKDRASWLVEEEQYLRQVNELQESVYNLERVRDTLRKDNDKLRGPGGSGRSDSAIGASTGSGIPRFTLNTQSLKKQLDHSAASTSFTQQCSQGQGTTPGNNNIVSAAFNKFKENQLKTSGGQLHPQPQPQGRLTSFDKKDLSLSLPVSQPSKTQSNRYKLAAQSTQPLASTVIHNDATDYTD